MNKVEEISGRVLQNSNRILFRFYFANLHILLTYIHVHVSINKLLVHQLFLMKLYKQHAIEFYALLIQLNIHSHLMSQSQFFKGCQIGIWTQGKWVFVFGNFTRDNTNLYNLTFNNKN